METENQKLRARVEELSRETMLLAHTVTELTAKLKLATSTVPQPVDDAQAAQQGEAIRKAMRQAYNLGQTYFAQADSNYTSQHKKSEVTAQAFQTLLESTVAMVESALAQPTDTTKGA